MALLQLLQKALLLLNVVLMLLLNMTGNGIAAATKKGITSAKDGAVTVLNYKHTRSLQPSVLPCQNSVCRSVPRGIIFISVLWHYPSIRP